MIAFFFSISTSLFIPLARSHKYGRQKPTGDYGDDDDEDDDAGGTGDYSSYSASGGG